MKHSKNKYLFTIISLAIFLVFLFDALVTGFFFGVDNAVNESMAYLRNPLLISVMTFFTILGNFYPMIVLVLVLVGLLLVAKKKKGALLLSVCMVIGLVVSELLKFVVQRVRPESTILLESGYSFPSQHAAMSAIFFLVLMYSFKDDIKNKAGRILFVLANIFMFLAIGFSRVYLGAHWLSDVIAGWALGIALVNFIIPQFFKKS